MKRRHFPIALTTAPSLCWLPAHAEPITVGAVIEVVASIAKAAYEIEKQKKFIRWRSDVTAKLATIEQNTLEIIRDLQQLRIDTRNIVVANSRDEFLARLEGANIVLRAAVADVKSTAPFNVDENRRLWAAASQLLYVLGQARYKDFGFSTMPFVLPSFSASQAILRLAGYPTAAAESKMDLLNK